ncbi:putative ABC transporter substrate-binding protein [Flavihumibacter petaseus NBRC 106054]|uniref:Putative ABC transporter substrate-binding protein n=2 Tax=Flavihumibacter TaxID=1004301 RepID=A0A0E9N3G8_9BACT|nr:putative ABC transporter substrate-binding protein [Flavihumibacter petaseus NBRC 106054]
MWIIHQLYSTLVEVGDDMEIRPSVADRWEISADGRIYRFHLKDSVWFHDSPCFPGGRGRRLKAADVVYSLRRLVDPATASSGAWIFNGKLDPRQGFRAVDDSTFELELYKAFPPILGMLSMQYCSIIPEEAVQFYGAGFRSHPVGSGPFFFLAYEEGQTLLLKRHRQYFEKDSSGQHLPYLPGIKITFNESKATEFLLFRQGQLHFVNDIDPSFKDEVLNKKGDLREAWKEQVTLKKHPYLNTEYLGILMDPGNALVRRSPLRWKQVRQAINYGFDRKKMMLYLRNSIGRPAENGFVPPGLPSFDSAAVPGYTFRPDTARKLVASIKRESGEQAAVTLLTIPIYSDLASYIARELQEIGLQVKVEVVQKSFLLEQTAQSQAMFFRGSWIADYPDAENYLSVFYSKNPAPPNYTRYSNPSFDKLYEAALLETNDSIRYGLYRSMDRLLVADAPVVPLWYDEVCWLVRKNVTGFTPNSQNLLELRHARLDQP